MKQIILSHLIQAVQATGLVPNGNIKLSGRDLETALKVSPSATIFSLGTKYRVDGSNVGRVPVVNSVNGLVSPRKRTFDGTSTYRVVVRMNKETDIENFVNKFLNWLYDNRLNDTQENFYELPKKIRGNNEVGDIILDFDDYGITGACVVTIDIQADCPIFNDVEMVEVDIVVECILEGGNPNE